MKLSEWGTDVLDVLLPAGCVACGVWIPGGAEAPLVCDRCRSRFRTAPWPRCLRCHCPRGAGRPEAPNCFECGGWSPAVTAARYAYILMPPADSVVHALKYEGWPELATLMGRALARLDVPESDGASTLVVPVPTTRGRMRARGYNQAELLAREVARARDLPLRLALSRRREARSQTSLSPSERRENVRGAFTPAKRGDRSVDGARVLLVDDVLTTGATASEAAEALAQMGASAVTLLAFARALPAWTRAGR